MITITVDLYNFSDPPSSAILAQRVEDYVSVRQRIRLALDMHQVLIVYVTHRTVLHWFDDFHQYPSSVIQWRYVDPTQKYIDLFGVESPSVLRLDLIKQLDLDSLPNPTPGTTVDPISWILGHRLDQIWSDIHGSQQHFAELIATICEQYSPYPDSLLPLIELKLGSWATYDPIYQTLNPHTLVKDAQRLINRWVFRNYKQEFFANDYREYINAPLMTMGHTQASRYIAVVHAQTDFIKSYWNSWFVERGQNKESLDGALHDMSGLSSLELAAIIQVLDKKPELLDSSLLSAIKTKFSFLPAGKIHIRDLAKRIPPDEPQIPSQEWTEERYLQWVTQEYMPYFSWVIRHKQNREYQQQCANTFSDWLLDHYPAWLNSANSPVIMNNYGVMSQLLEDDPNAIVLWLVVDGLTWWQGALLYEVCESHGLWLQMNVPNIAILPSITTISKRVLVTGVTNADPSLSIVSVARLQFNKSRIEHFISANRDDLLREFRQQSSRCYVLLDNMIDTIAHQGSNFTDNRAIKGHLEDLAQLAGDLYQICETNGQNFHLLVSSDHGSTLLPSEAIMLPLPRNTNAIDEVDDQDMLSVGQSRSTRAASIADLGQLPSYEHEQWYILHKDRYQLPAHYIVPRGYNYLSRRPSGWTHGGLTPEEVVVPFIHLTSNVRHVIPLEIQLVGGLQLSQSSIVRLVFTNFNKFPFERATMRLPSLNLTINIDSFSSNGKTEISIEFPSVKTEKSEVEIAWRLDTSLFGIPHSQEGQTTMPIRRLQIQDNFEGFDI
ncbi:hypothetical protein [Herpetosiphon gulosus]|uniref:PglZ domain-containing protein n=1 Tax=Herpetosiphon gulosus TaxID=1973496 RepID=A0ABP9X0C6_9CHLR